MANAKMTWRTLKIQPDGTVDPMPDVMHGDTGDGIVWFVENEAGADVKVKIKDFKKRPLLNAVNAVTFLVDSCSVADGEGPGMIVGQITYLPPAGVTVRTKYTIDVKVTGVPRQAHDPDLEIVRP